MLLLGSKANPRPGSKSSSDNAHDRNASDLWRWLFGISIFSSFMVCYIVNPNPQVTMVYFPLQFLRARAAVRQPPAESPA